MTRLDPTPVDPPADDARPLGAAEVARLVGVGDDQVRKWMLKGVRINGRVVRLSASQSIGHRYRTTLAEVRAFQRACQAARGLEAVADAPSPAAVNRRARKAKDEAARLLG